MEDQTAIDIIKHLVQEIKELRERLDVTESILHSYLPIIENKCKDQ